MKRVILMLLMGLSVLSSAISGGTMATFTTTASNVAASFTAGTLVITTDRPSSAIFTVTNMKPGDATSVDLRVENLDPESVSFRYAMTIAATNPDGKAARQGLVLTVKDDVCANGAAATLYSGTFFDPAAPAYNSEMKVFGDPASGAQAGDRALTNGASEYLCLRVSLPVTTGNALQGATTTATFTLYAEQS